MQAKSIIRNILPYGLVGKIQSKRQIKRSLLCSNNGKCFLPRVQNVAFDDHSKYKHIVSVQGFGYSGSGAVVDLLREYETITVVGGVDKEGSLTNRNISKFEVDFLRLSGGLLEVEKYLNSSNMFQNDALSHRMLQLFESNPIYRGIPGSRVYFQKFFDQICWFTNCDKTNQYYNLHLHQSSTQIFYLREMTLSEYRNLCRKFLNSIFNLVSQYGATQVLAMDQLFSDLEFDIERNMEYVPNLKTIVVYRDPRDVFAYACRNNVEWIPHTNSKIFVSWYNQMLSKFNKMEKQQYYVVQFEDLVYNYENCIQGIEMYLELSTKCHINKKCNFNPNVSMQNIGIWRQDLDRKKDYEYIYSELNDYCYN